MAVSIKLLTPTAKVPLLGSRDSAGYDLYAERDVHFLPGEIKTVALGFATEIPTNIHGRIESRSGRALDGWVVQTGVIDADYRGEWKVILKNDSPTSRRIDAGDRIAQVVFRHTLQPGFAVSESLDDTARGAGGFGSTGTS